MKKIFLTAIVIFALAAPMFVLAAAPVCKGLNCALGNLDAIAGTDKTGLSSDLPTVVATVIKAVLALVGTVFLVLTIYAGILWMTAQGEEEKVTKAKDIIKASIIGLVIIMSAYAITYFVTSRLTAATTSPAAAPIGCCAPRDNSGVCLDVAESDCDLGVGIGGNVWTADPCSPTCGDGS